MKKQEPEELTIEKYSKEFKDNFSLAKAAIKVAHHNLESDKEFDLKEVFNSVIKHTTND
jgi:hypothetical protein